MAEHGLGYIPSPLDERDFSIEEQYSAEVLAATLPTSYRVPHLSSTVFDQGTTPMCVAYSGATEQASFDLGDTGHNYKWDFPYFFRKIGGTVHGAIIRNALDFRLHRGYPLQPPNSGNSMSQHRIRAYYAVPLTRDSVKRALVHYGVLIIGTDWYNSWFEPYADGTLPPPDYVAGGHAIAIVGYDAHAVTLRNTWGKDWAKNGECRMPWSYLLQIPRECWKAVDADS